MTPSKASTGLQLRSLTHKQVYIHGVLEDLKTTFACHYNREVSLAEALQLDNIAVYSKRSTGGKYLINPSRNPDS